MTHTSIIDNNFEYILKRALTKLNPHGKTFYDQVSQLTDTEWKAILKYSVHHPRIAGIDFPTFPNNTIQTRTVGSANEKCLREAFVFYDVFKWAIKELDIQADNLGRLLDFGVGFGRIYRMFLKDYSQDNVIGCDVNQSYIDICRETIPFGVFHKNRIHPPLDFPNEHFTAITAYSVFSHLNQDVALKWLDEFFRILEPGGMVLFTVRTFHFVSSSMNLKSNQLDPKSPIFEYQKRLSSLYNEIDEIYSRYKNGEFIYPEDVNEYISDETDNSLNGYYNSQYYSESVVSLKWLFSNIKNFEIIFYSDIPHILPQAFVLLRKPCQASTDRNAFEYNISLYADTRTGIPTVCIPGLKAYGNSKLNSEMLVKVAEGIRSWQYSFQNTENVVLFGCGSLAKWILLMFDSSKINIISCFDNNGKILNFQGIPVQKPHFILNAKVIIAASYDQNIIFEQLIELGYKTEDVLYFGME